MPTTKTPYTPEGDASHADGDDNDDAAARKRTARSYRTYDRGGRDDYDDDEGQYTPYSDDTFESDYDRRDTGKKNQANSNGKIRGGKRSDGAARAPRGGNSRALRQFVRGSRVSPGSNASRDNVAQRVQSARRLRTNELKNEIESLTRDLLEMRRENALLRRTQHIQERNLERFEDRESNLPQLLESHGREVRALRDQLRKSKERAERAERTARDADEELAAVRKQVRRLQGLVDDRQLAERDALSRRVAELETSLQERTERCQELERHVENLEKNHGRELRTEMKKLKEARAENELLQQNVGKLQQQLKEKEKELDVANIYHARLSKAQQQQQQRGSLPALDAPPSPRPPLGARKAHTPDDSPRDRARRLDDRRREALRRRREAADKQLALIKVAGDSQTGGGEPSLPPPSLPPAEGRRAPARAVAAPAAAAERDDSWDRIRLEQERIEAERRQRRATPPLTTRRQEQEATEDRSRSTEDGNSLLFFATEVPNADRFSREANEEAERRERAAAAAATEQRETEARLERERFERSERRRLELEREERERVDRERRSQIERAEREQREEEERRSRAREEEQRRLASDNTAAEERRKKDMLLRMMRDIDDKKEPAVAASIGDTNAVHTLAGTAADGGGASALGKQPPNGRRKEYSFRNADENLHHGVPVKPARNAAAALDGEPIGRKAKGGHDSGDDRSEPSAYAPSFAVSSPSKEGNNDALSSKKVEDKSVAKKSKLLNTLFGSDGGSAQTAGSGGGNKGTFGEDDIFSSTTKAKPVADRRAYPWEASEGGGGGGGKVKDEAALMPRRQRLEPSAVHSKPTVTAISSATFEDEIEELVL